MPVRIAIFDHSRKVLILTTSLFPSLLDLKNWANSYIMGLCPELTLLICDNKNNDLGFLKPTPNGFETVGFTERSNLDGQKT